MRWFRDHGRAGAPVFASAVLVLTLTGAMAAPVRAASADRELTFLEMINSARSARGLARLRNDPELQRVAVAWTKRMAGSGRLSHNPNLASDYHGSWTKLGENVGRGGSATDIERAFEASPEHLRNILDPEFDSIAVSVIESGGTLYVTQQFRAIGTPSPGAPVALAAVVTVAVATVAVATVAVGTVAVTTAGSGSVLSNVVVSNPAVPPTSASILANSFRH